MRAPEFWGTSPGLAAGMLAPFGALWEGAARLRRIAVQPYRPAVPVICVGNLVAGGSGKTPVVLSLAGMCAAGGCEVHVVTRGYGGKLAGPVRVDGRRHDAAAVGDEAMLLAERAPCWVARDRAAGVRTAVAAGAEAILLDDGFQNPTIEKDLSLVVVDAEYGFGNGHVMPAGPLRESVAAGLARAGAVVLLGDGDGPEALRRAGCPELRARLQPLGAGWVAGASVIAFAGIGRPEKFFASLRVAGANVAAAHTFPDHHRFTSGELARLRSDAARIDARLVTTAKDWVRLPVDWRDGVAVLEVEICWEDLGAVMRLLSGVLRPAADQHADGYDRSAARA